MRITRDNLIRLAQETADQRARSDRGIVCIYAIGSLLTADPLLGGTTDIDLVFVHDLQPDQRREVVRLSSDVHLDIAHLPQSLYRHPRQLRQDPWIGSSLYSGPLLLHDTQHWFDFTQASVKAQFWQADNVNARSRQLLSQARQGWLRLDTNGGATGVSNGFALDKPFPASKVIAYLQALEHAANAVAALSGEPMTERRFLLLFRERSQAAGNPGLAIGLAGLAGAPLVDGETIRSWLGAWQQAFQKAGSLPGAPARLHPSRFGYYERAFEAFLSADRPAESHPQDALWPLLRTWTRAAELISDAHPSEDEDELTAWRQACALLQLDPQHFPDRLKGLDAFLDSIEELLEKWAQENGVSV